MTRPEATRIVKEFIELIEKPEQEADVVEINKALLAHALRTVMVMPPKPRTGGDT